MEHKKNTGRPPIISETILRKLEEGYSMGFTDKEACLYANIAPSTLYKYCAENGDFSERKQLLKNTLSMHAKRNLAGAIKKGDMKSTYWLLDKDEDLDFFSNGGNFSSKSYFLPSAQELQEEFEKLYKENRQIIMQEELQKVFG